jgi:hypothetical protein
MTFVSFLTICRRDILYSLDAPKICLRCYIMEVVRRKSAKILRRFSLFFFQKIIFHDSNKISHESFTLMTRFRFISHNHLVGSKVEAEKTLTGIFNLCVP